MMLSPHFSLEELTRSELALRNGIENSPPPEVVEHLRALAYGLEGVRRILGQPMHVQSGYRCEALERILTEKSFRAWAAARGKAPDEAAWAEYFATKDHPQGYAADWVCPGFGPPAECARAVRDSEIRYDQLILEFSSWAHTSFNPIMRMQVLTIDGGGTRQGLG